MVVGTMMSWRMMGWVYDRVGEWWWGSMVSGRMMCWVYDRVGEWW